MKPDKDRGYKKSNLKIPSDRAFEITAASISGDSVSLTVEVEDYEKPGVKAKEIKITVPLSALEGSFEAVCHERIDAILEREARRLVATERVNALVGHQYRFQYRGRR